MKKPIMFYIIKQKEWVKQYSVRGDMVKMKTNNSLCITVLNRYEKYWAFGKSERLEVSKIFA